MGAFQCASSFVVAVPGTRNATDNALVVFLYSNGLRGFRVGNTPKSISMLGHGVRQGKHDTLLPFV
jgi:hypothetical protein